MTASLPTTLLEVASAFGEQRLALIIGAGCSKESPTDLPLSREISTRAHERLIDDGVLAPGECPTPEDLSVLADVVYAKLGRQFELVTRMEPARLRDAATNEGYLCAVALMLEGVIKTIVTLNFDLALSHALAEVEATGRVATLRGPDQWPQMATPCAVYLHRNVESDWEELVLRTDQLDEAWKDGWQELVARAAVSTPVCVFAGLGSPARVLSASTAYVKQAVGTAQVYLVGPGAWEDSEFAQSLDIPETAYVQLGWTEFMSALASRTLREHKRRVMELASRIAEANGLPVEDVSATTDRLFLNGIASLGRARARWLRQGSGYLALSDDTANQLVADLIMGVALIERVTNAEIQLISGYLLEFRRPDRIVGRLMLASGQGVLKGEAVAARVRRAMRSGRAGGDSPSVVLLGGITTGVAGSIPPADVVEEVSRDDVVYASAEPVFVTLEDLRNDPTVVERSWNLA